MPQPWSALDFLARCLGALGSHEEPGAHRNVSQELRRAAPGGVEALLGQAALREREEQPFEELLAPIAIRTAPKLEGKPLEELSRKLHTIGAALHPPGRLAMAPLEQHPDCFLEEQAPALGNGLARPHQEGEQAQQQGHATGIAQTAPGSKESQELLDSLRILEPVLEESPLLRLIQGSDPRATLKRSAGLLVVRWAAEHQDGHVGQRFCPLLEASVDPAPLLGSKLVQAVQEEPDAARPPAPLPECPSEPRARVNAAPRCCQLFLYGVEGMKAAEVRLARRQGGKLQVYRNRARPHPVRRGLV